MKRECCSSLVFTFAISALWTVDAKTQDYSQRPNWTSSKVIGSPDPPLPFRASQVFVDMELKTPIYVIPVPHTNNLLVVESDDSKSVIHEFANQENAQKKTQWLEMDRRIYGLTFDDEYEKNKFVFVFSAGQTGQRKFNRVSRFQVIEADSAATMDPKSELIILEWDSAGHDGGDLAFGNDGMLYITSGDGSTDSDTLVSGQDITNLLATLIRIDVSHASSQNPYRIPKDNPFIHVQNARPEIWAFGFRNPWRMAIDRPSGQIWVGNNGQDLWETAYLVRKGDNYGWSVYEGNYPFYLNRQLGPAPFVPPTVEHHHREARSLTGGVVYRGKRLAELNGVYVYGDYSTGKIWGAQHDGNQLLWNREIADTTIQIVAFRVDQKERLLIVDHGGKIFELVANEAKHESSKFPTRLSESGLFESVADHRLAAGVLAYAVNSPAWVDGARVERYLALPGDKKVEYRPDGPFEIPNEAVILQTMFLDDPETGTSRRMESRLLTRQQNEWAGYSYRWNEAQSDAFLVDRNGADAELPRGSTEDENNVRQWRFPSRAECMVCHSRAANYVLGISHRQLNRDVTDGSGQAIHQLRHLENLAVFKNPLPKNLDLEKRLADPYDDSLSVEDRARAYLHTNCASCHTEAGGGNADMRLTIAKQLDATRTIYARPLHDTFEINNAMIIQPGEPEHSILFQRISRRGKGQMPPLVSQHIDTKAVDLMRSWIQSLKQTRPIIQEWRRADFASNLNSKIHNRSIEEGSKAVERAGCLQCHQLNKKGSGIGPNLTSVGQRLKPEELLEALLNPSKTVVKEYANTQIISSDGLTYVGRIEFEDDTKLVLRTANQNKRVTIEKSEVEDRQISQLSPMPTGTLNTLTREEIYDLLAFLMAAKE